MTFFAQNRCFPENSEKSHNSARVNPLSGHTDTQTSKHQCSRLNPTSYLCRHLGDEAGDDQSRMSRFPCIFNTLSHIRRVSTYSEQRRVSDVAFTQLTCNRQS